MKIDIIVPVYNSKKYIDKIIKSIINQNYQNYELILIDDGSTDGSYEYMKKFENNRIKVYKQNNSGPGIARKNGFLKSNGDLVFFVDSDDWISYDNALSDINYIFKNNEIDILFFDREDIIGNNKTIIKSFNKMSYGIHSIDELCEKIRPGLGSKIFKRTILESSMFINSNVYEDLYTTYLYVDKIQKFYYCDSCFYTIYHEENSNTLSSNWTNQIFGKSIQIVTSLYDKIKNITVKESLTYMFPQIFMNYCKKIIKKQYKRNTDTDIESGIIKIVEIIKNEKIDFSNNIVKNTMFWLLINIYYSLKKKR